MPTDIETPKAKLLEAAIECVAQRGISDLSLRELAAALGTSHRMLIYHFGSKDGLLVEVVRTIEARERSNLAGLLASSRSPLDAARTFWKRLSDPALAPYERLFFEVYGQALQGHAYARPLLDGIVESWLDPVGIDAGPLSVGAVSVGAADARAEARLGVAVVRGLLLDLLATGDTAGVDAAFEQYVSGLVARTGTRRVKDGAPD
jgi:AcrR family transcriptional regulator